MGTCSCFTVTLCVQKEAEDRTAGCSDRKVTLLYQACTALHFSEVSGQNAPNTWEAAWIALTGAWLFIISLSSEMLFSLYCHTRLPSRWCIGLSCCPVSYSAIVRSTFSFKREACHSLKETIKCCWFPLWEPCTLVASEDFFGISLCYEALNPGWDQFFREFLLLQRNIFR